ncbi:MAG TPA: glycosyltransferase family 2 protein [Candidatus Didemnitutus sp.]|nr:glycosyltransferase family 2 protein [Candidatus Didemnitutus sp.]
MTAPTPLPLSVVILTFNEEKHLPACLASIAACDDVVVLDSGSTDRTVAIARAAGARVVTHPFEDFARQRNFALQSIPFRHPFVFQLDADETPTPALLAECVARSSEATVDGFFAAPHMMFAGRWLRHCTDFPAWQARFVRVATFRYIQVGHGQREAPEMKMDFLREPYLHDVTVDDEAVWEQKHRRYARQEAAEYLANHRAARVNWGSLLRGPALERRRNLKILSHRLPARSLARLTYQYLWRCGFLDGAPGWRYCRLLARYEGYIAGEIRRQRREVAHSAT